jgi:hypothetical protein
VTWAFRQARAFHAERGLRLSARLRVARGGAAWRRLLGGPAADRYAGYADLRGTVLLGPAATAGLEGLRRARDGGRLSPADADAAVMGLAVLLHETLHATGPAARADALGTRSGRAFEEGFTEAATDDLLGRFVAGLDLPARMRARLAAGVARRRHAYGPEVGFARRMSARATRSAVGSPRARAWRIMVADTWGAGRWTRLAAATGRDEAVLRGLAAARTTRGALR